MSSANHAHNQQSGHLLRINLIITLSCYGTAGIMALLAYMVPPWGIGVGATILALVVSLIIGLAVRHFHRQQHQSEYELRLRTEQVLTALSRQSALLAAIPAEVYFLDRELRYITVNQSLAEAMGLSADQMVGRTDADIRPDTQAEQIMQANRTVVSSGKALLQQEEQLTDPSGQPRWLLTNRVPLLGASGAIDGLVAISIDITNLKQLEAELRSNREELQLILDGANLGTWDLSMPNDLMRVDHRYASMLGLEPTAITRRDDWLELVHPVDRSLLDTAMEAHLANQLPALDLEYRLRHRQGHWVWMLLRGKLLQRDAHGRALRMAGTHLDINQRKATERLLHDERDLFLGGPLVVLRWRADGDQSLRHSSGNAKDVLGFDAIDLIAGRPTFNERIHPDEKARVVQMRHSLMISGGSEPHEPYRFRRQDGEWLWLLEHDWTVRNDQGRITDVLAYVVDISTRVRAEQRWRRNLAELERFNRLMLGREERILALKAEVNDALVQGGQASRYEITTAGTEAQDVIDT
jgi:PAS domain S-box-containing protein